MGVVARGYVGSSSEGTMVHEMTHNLGPGDCADRSIDGQWDDMWGRHVSDENKLSALDDPTGQCIGGDAGQNYGCGAAGPDPDWQALFDDGSIGEVGFDTREPWSASGSPLTVVPADYPDYMSYCQSDEDGNFQSNQLPTKWISPYRWERLFDRFSTLRSASRSLVETQALIPEIKDVLYVSGVIAQKDGGILKPIKVSKGTLSPIREKKAAYAIELLDSKGTLQYRFPFNVSFFEREGGEDNSVPFQFRLPYLRGTATVELLRQGELLDRIRVSKNTPKLEVISPNGGEVWKERRQKIEWFARDLDEDVLTFSVFYSNDEGKTWRSVARNLGNKALARRGSYVFEIDRTTLPGGLPKLEGKSARIRIIGTDGYNTAQDDSDGSFTVPKNPPVVSIVAPADGAWYQPGEKIFFRGMATDTEDDIIPDGSYLWSSEDDAFAVGPAAEALLPPGYHLINLIVYDSDGEQGYAEVEILVAEICNGDFDADGDVDGGDVKTMAEQLGCEGACPADFNHNQRVDKGDLEVFLEDYGRVNCPIVPQDK
jgi:hypothetical protein